MVNVANINLMIEAISAQAEPIHMGTFVDRNAECGTTACLAGWANILASGAQGKLDQQRGLIDNNWVDFGDAEKAADWMDIGFNQQRALFFDYRADYLPNDERKNAAIALLTELRDTGEARWNDVLPEHLQKDDDEGDDE
jgi:hypothetical protein